MSTHKHIDRICVVITLLALLITGLFMNGEALGLSAAERTMGYEKTLFDTSRVHTIDIVIDDWDAFIQTATSEEYAACSVVIDNEAVKNVAIRGKGNTSLSSVASMGSQRYSLKLESDHYETGKTYKGLDKLCLNNLIQDNTYMKDYLAYRLMAEFGADAPLCSYVWVTVNGEDWGLYLAVEAVEDSFMQRVYGGEGDLYKPDSMSMGGGPGNGQDFNIEDFVNENAEAMGFPWGNSESGENAESAETPAPSEQPSGEAGNPGGGEASSAGGNEASSAGGGPGGAGPGGGQGAPSGMPGGGDRPSPPGGDGGFPGGSQGENGPGGGQGAPSGMPGGGDRPSPPGGDGGFPGGDSGFPGGGGAFPGGDGGGFPGGFGGFGGGMGMGSGDVKLQYADDDPDNYSNIFGNAKTAVTDADQVRLIRSLKTLSEGENLEDVLEIDELLRYFVVHNYLVNGDSYTGAMVHNYYLHEADGKLRMIPWDYNLAFGTFQGSDATSAVNDPIDSPLSVSGDGSRPLADWIFLDEAYTELYHQYFAEFLDAVDITAMIDETYALIAPYVEKDPTAFCSYEEFETGVETLRSFCEKRTESVRGQLDGTIPSTDEGQQADSSALIDASELTLSDMGSMGGGGEGGFPGGGGNPFGGGPGQDAPQQGSAPGGNEASSAGGGQMPGGNEASSAGGGQTPGGNEASSSGGGQTPGGNEASSGGGGPTPGGKETGDPDGEAPPAATGAAPEQEATERPSAPGGFDPGERPDAPSSSATGAKTAGWPMVLICAAVLIGGLLAALLYKRRK